MSVNKKEQEMFRLTYAIDGKPCFAEMVAKGARLEGLFRPSMPHCTFDGWGEVPARMPAHDLTLEGHFTKEIFRVIFAAGVEQYGVFEMPAGCPVPLPPTPKREGCEFIRWEGFHGVMPAENRTFEAVFTPRVYRVTYAIDDTYFLHINCPCGEKFPVLPPPRKANHIFSGWSEIPEIMPAGDVTVTGHFEEQRFKLTRVVDGTVFSEEYLPHGAVIDKKAKPVQEGYYFSGWRKLPDTMPAHDVEVVASMYPARYRVDYVINGKIINSIYVPFGERIPTETVEEKTGKLFSGWEDLPPVMPAHDIAVHGTISSILYRLSFMVNGEEIDRREIAEGDPIPADVDLPPKAGQAFVGWEHAPETMPAHDLTLNAVYAAVQSRYVFMIDGKVYSDVTPAASEELVMPEPPKKRGKPFGGWSSAEQNPRTGVTTYYGSYSSATTHRVTYMLQDEVVGEETLRTGAKLHPPMPDEDETYEFLGWDELPLVMPPNDLVVYGTVRQLKYTLEFEVDGEIVYSMTMDAGQEIACPSLAAREGYTFAGWQDVPAVMPREDLTIHGSFRIRSHTVTYLLEGKEIYSATLKYGEPLVAPDLPEEEDSGRVFVGWVPDISAMPDRDVIISGAFSDTICLTDIYVDGIYRETIRLEVGKPPVMPNYPVIEGTKFIWQDVPAMVPPGRLEVHGGYVKNTYTVTYLCGDRVVGEERYPYGATLKPRVENPTSEDGPFLGWRDLPMTMPSRDLNVHAMFAERTYHVTFRLDGRVFYEADVPVGAPTPTPEVPEREGYHFDGWRNFVDVMPPYNFTAYGAYSRRTYHITYLCGDDVVEEQDYVSGAPIVAPPAPMREHCTFRTWEGLGTHMPTEDITVSARYIGENYRISFVIDGVLVFTDELEFGAKVEPFEPEKRGGVAFTGWHNMPVFMPAHEVIVTGSYEVKLFTVTYKVDGMIYRIDTYEAGEAILPPAAPEHEYETFVRWRNFAPVMPEYDFTCTAEYSVVYRHYSFVLDGEVLKEGQARKGEMLIVPEPPHRSGFAFAGWDGFTGYMPAEDVTYIGSYTADKFKVVYYLDDAYYCEEGYDEGDRIVPVDGPETEGYVFTGWSGLPNIMPSDDVVVRGHMKPIEYRLVYRTDGKKTVFDGYVPCGTPLGKVAAPEKFGYEFCGWSEEPETMPAHAFTINGNYRSTGEEFVQLSCTETSGFEKSSVRKAPPREPNAILFIAGEYVRIVVEGICYPVPIPTGKVAVRNGMITDEELLTDALRRIWRKYRLPKKVQVVVADSAKTDQFHTLPAEAAPLTREEIDRLFADCGKWEDSESTVIPLSKTETSARFLLSRLRTATRTAVENAFLKCGVSVTATRTMVGALVEYLQPNRKMERGKNQICLFYLPNAVIGILMIDGQVASVIRNKYPFDGRDWDVREYTEKIMYRMVREAHRAGTELPLRMIAVGGIDRTHVRSAEKCVAAYAKTAVEQIASDPHDKLFGGVAKWRRPQVVRLGYAHVENRTK